MSNSKKVWTISRRTGLAIIAIAAVITIVSASLLANYIIPTNSYRVTAGPGLTVFEADGVTKITSIAWGDIQIPSSTSPGVTQTHTVTMKDTGGASSPTVYLVDTGTACSPSPCNPTTVNFLLPTGLATGVHLVSNFDTLTTAAGAAFTCTVGTVTYTHCIALTPGGSMTPVITLTLSADSTATPTTTSNNFTLEFDVFSTPTG